MRKNNNNQVQIEGEAEEAAAGMRDKVGLNPFFIAFILSVYGQAIKPSNSHRAGYPFGII